MRTKQLFFKGVFLLFLGIHPALFAQGTDIVLVPKEVKPGKVIFHSDITGNIDFTGKKNTLKLVLNNEFSRLITGNALAGIGNYASIDTENNTLKAGISLIRNSEITTFKLSTAATDGISKLLSNGKLNGAFSLGVSHHFLLDDKKIAIDESNITAINSETIRLKDAYEKEYVAAKNFVNTAQEKINKLSLEKGKLIKELEKLKNPSSEQTKLDKEQLKYKSIDKKIKTALKSIRSQIKKQKKRPARTTFQIAKKNNSMLLLLDSLYHLRNIEKLNQDKIATNNDKQEALKKVVENQIELAKICESKIKVLDQEITALTTKQQYYKDNVGEITGTLRNNVIDAFRTNINKINEIKPTDIKIRWISVGVDLNYQTFNLFDASRALEEQVYQDSDLVPTFFVALSGYLNCPLFNCKEEKGKGSKKRASNILDDSFNTKHIKYYSLGFQGAYGNNLSSLELTEVRTTTAVAPGRDLIKRQNAYLGSFKEEELSGQFFIDYYQFIGNRNNVGIHLKSTLDVGSFRPVVSTRAGVLIPFLDSKNVQSSVNLEIFFGLNDLFNKASKKSLFGRNVFGVQASLPLNFKFL